MNSKSLFSLISVFIASVATASLLASDFPQGSTFSTLITTPLAIEGLTGDATGNLYTTGRATAPDLCPVWSINKDKPQLIIVGFIPNPAACNPTGIAFDTGGNLYIADAAGPGAIWVLTPSAANPPTATLFASGVPGTNGVAFDRHGNLWTGDGTTGQGRVWRISRSGIVEEVFRIQPLANEVNLDATGTGGVGRDVRSLPPGTITVTPTSRNATNLLGSQPLVANGLAFFSEVSRKPELRGQRQDVLYIADTGRGAIWKVEFESDGSLKSKTNCDTTFTENTLCLDNVFVAHPILEGADGIALDRQGNIWVSANERNAIVVVTPNKQVIEIFRNGPSSTTQLRNTGPLEFPTSPFLLGRLFCTSNSDGNRRDNSPSTAGEIGGSDQDRGKISCMDQELTIPGVPLPFMGRDT
jgi:sugar lactone lactonase YvrE